MVYNADRPFPYTLEEYLSVFRYFFDRYEEERGEKHPPIKTAQLRKIMEVMPWIEDAFIEPDVYPDLIDSYFAAVFRGCDYRINHFFSGSIRALRQEEIR